MATEQEVVPAQAAPTADVDGANARRPYSPEEALQQLNDIPEDKRSFTASNLIGALTCQRHMMDAYRSMEKRGDENITLDDIAKVILYFLKNVYHLASSLPGALMFDALEDLMGRCGLLVPFLSGMRVVDGTVVLQLGLPSNESLCDNHEELIRIAATAVVCFYHYTNYPAHPDFFPSDDAALLFSSLALRSCQNRATAEALEAQLGPQGPGGGIISLAELRWLLHYVRGQLSGLSGAVYLALGNTQAHKQQLLAQQADFLGLIKAVPANPAGYIYYVRTCLQFQQLAAAGLFAAKGAVVAERHAAHLYAGTLAAQRAIALALQGGGSSSTGGSAAAPAAGDEVSPAAKAAAARAAGDEAAAAAEPPSLVRAGELRSLLDASRAGLAAEVAVLPEVYGDLVNLDPVDSKMLAEKLDPMVQGVPDEGEVLALTQVFYPTRPPFELPRGAMIVRKEGAAEDAGERAPAITDGKTEGAKKSGKSRKAKK